MWAFRAPHLLSTACGAPACLAEAMNGSRPMGDFFSRAKISSPSQSLALTRAIIYRKTIFSVTTVQHPVSGFFTQLDDMVPLNHSIIRPRCSLAGHHIAGANKGHIVREIVYLDPPEASIRDLELCADAPGCPVIAQADTLAQRVSQAQPQEACIPCLSLQVSLQPPQTGPLCCALPLKAVLLCLRTSDFSLKGGPHLSEHAFILAQSPQNTCTCMARCP